MGRFEPSETPPPPKPQNPRRAAFWIPLITSIGRRTANFTVPENKTIPPTLDMPTGLRKLGPHRRGKVGGDFPKQSRGTEHLPTARHGGLSCLCIFSRMLVVLLVWLGVMLVVSDIREDKSGLHNMYPCSINTSTGIASVYPHVCFTKPSLHARGRRQRPQKFSEKMTLLNPQHA